MSWFGRKLAMFARAVRVARNPHLTVSRDTSVAIDASHTRIRVDVEGVGVLRCGDLVRFINGDYRAQLAIPTGDVDLVMSFQPLLGRTLRESVFVQPTLTLARPAVELGERAWDEELHSQVSRTLAQLSEEAGEVAGRSQEALPLRTARSIEQPPRVVLSTTALGEHAPGVEREALMHGAPGRQQVTLQDVYARR